MPNSKVSAYVCFFSNMERMTVIVIGALGTIGKRVVKASEKDNGIVPAFENTNGQK